MRARKVKTTNLFTSIYLYIDSKSNMDVNHNFFQMGRGGRQQNGGGGGGRGGRDDRGGPVRNKFSPY